MEVGQTASATIQARAPWNDTRIDLVQGGIYQLTAEGKWWDLFIQADADGYPTKLWPQGHYESRRRVPTALWFCLVGVIASVEGRAFAIGRHAQIEAETQGRLFCCANDVPGYYFNNFGKLQLLVQRVR